MSTQSADDGLRDGRYQALQLRTNGKILRYQARLHVAQRGLRDTLIAVRAEAGIESAEPMKEFAEPPPLPVIDQTRSLKPPAVPAALQAATAKTSGWVARISRETGMPVVVPISEERLGATGTEKARRAR